MEVLIPIFSIGVIVYSIYTCFKKYYTLESEFDEIKDLSKTINFQDINYSKEDAILVLNKIASKNKLAQKLVNIIEKDIKERPYVVYSPACLDANFMLFFASKGTQKQFWDKNYEFAKKFRRHPETTWSAIWAINSIIQNNKEFFLNSEIPNKIE